MPDLEQLAKHVAVIEAAKKTLALVPVAEIHDEWIARGVKHIATAVAKVCEPYEKWMRAAIDEMSTATFDLRGKHCRGLNCAISVGRKLLDERTALSQSEVPNAP